MSSLFYNTLAVLYFHGSWVYINCFVLVWMLLIKVSGGEEATGDVYGTVIWCSLRFAVVWLFSGWCASVLSVIGWTNWFTECRCCCKRRSTSLTTLEAFNVNAHCSQNFLILLILASQLFMLFPHFLNPLSNIFLKWFHLSLLILPLLHLNLFKLFQL